VFTDAFTVLLLLQVPPPDAVRVVVLPIQTVCVPVIEPGDVLTVTTFEVLQPVANVYSIVVKPVVPPAVTIPVDASTVATAPLLLVHTPPAGVLLSSVELLTQIDARPVIAVGSSLTVA
jgi:hypothetical protein